VTQGECCPFCAARINRKIPYNGKTLCGRKKKRAQGTQNLRLGQNLPVDADRTEG
jgi:hypothetical protein